MRFSFFKISFYAVILFLLVYVCSCRNEIDCLNTSTNLVKLSFFDSTRSIQSLVFDSVFAIGLEDSIFYDTMSTADTLFSIPVNPFELNTMFVFILTQETESDTLRRSDTLHLGYTIRQRVITEECGAVQFYNQLDTLFHTFDSLVIDRSDLSTINARNIRIFN